MAVKRITLNQLLDNKEDWTFLYQSNTWQYYLKRDWTEKVRIKRKIVCKYLDGELERKPPNWEQIKAEREKWGD